MSLPINPDFSSPDPRIKPLFEHSAKESFFSHPAWYAVLSHHAMSGAKTRLYADNAGGCALLLQEQRGAFGSRVLSSLANYYSCEHAPLLRNEAAGAFGEILDAIRVERPGWDALSLAGLDPKAEIFSALLRDFRRARMPVRPYFDFGTWYETTTGMSFAQYLAARPSQLRNTFKRKRKRLAGGTRLRLAYYQDADSLDQGIADYETIYRSSWKGVEPHPDFMPALIRACGGLGALRLGVYHLDGVPAAAQFWILWNGRATIFKLAHDERFDEYSLGTLLTMEMTERILECERPSEISLGRGDDPYKKLWLPRRRERWGIFAANPRRMRGLALAGRETAALLYRKLRPARADGGEAGQAVADAG